jgi:hypothetical protein
MFIWVLLGRLTVALPVTSCSPVGSANAEGVTSCSAVAVAMLPSPP